MIKVLQGVANVKCDVHRNRWDKGRESVPSPRQARLSKRCCQQELKHCRRKDAMEEQRQERRAPPPDLCESKAAGRRRALLTTHRRMKKKREHAFRPSHRKQLRDLSTLCFVAQRACARRRRAGWHGSGHAWEARVEGLERALSFPEKLAFSTSARIGWKSPRLEGKGSLREARKGRAAFARVPTR